MQAPPVRRHLQQSGALSGSEADADVRISGRGKHARAAVWSSPGGAQSFQQCPADACPQQCDIVTLLETWGFHVLLSGRFLSSPAMPCLLQPRDDCLAHSFRRMSQVACDAWHMVFVEKVSGRDRQWLVQAMRFGNDLEACLKAIQIGFELSPRPSDAVYQGAVKTLEMVVFLLPSV